MKIRERWSAPRALAAGTLAVALLDGLDAVVFFGLRGVSPIRIGQAIAAGLLGAGAFAGGVPAALLGAALHVFIAACVVGFYFAASRALPVLARQPLVWGPLYGVGVWTVMQYVVIPLSASPAGATSAAVVVNGLAIHILGVGVPTALASHAARERAPQPASLTVAP